MGTTTTFAYDKSGRLTTQYSSAEAHYYSYNQRNMITQIQDVKSSSPDANRYFTYNALGERVYGIDGTATPSYWAYDGNRMLLEQIGSNKARYQHGNAPQDFTGSMVEHISASDLSTCYPVLKEDGSILQLNDTGGPVSDTYETSRFGVVLGSNIGISFNAIPPSQRFQNITSVFSTLIAASQQMNLAPIGGLFLANQAMLVFGGLGGWLFGGGPGRGGKVGIGPGAAVNFESGGHPLYKYVPDPNAPPDPETGQPRLHRENWFVNCECLWLRVRKKGKTRSGLQHPWYRDRSDENGPTDTPNALNFKFEVYARVKGYAPLCRREQRIWSSKQFQTPSGVEDSAQPPPLGYFDTSPDGADDNARDPESWVESGNTVAWVDGPGWPSPGAPGVPSPCYAKMKFRVRVYNSDGSLNPGCQGRFELQMGRNAAGGHDKPDHVAPRMDITEGGEPDIDLPKFGPF